jgi:hypothetical protein
MLLLVEPISSLDRSEVGVETVEGHVPEACEAVDPVAASRSGAVSRWLARHLPDRLREMRAASSSTLRCRETAGIDIGKGALSSVTVASRSANSARIARRVGSASAENTRLT